MHVSINPVPATLARLFSRAFSSAASFFSLYFFIGSQPLIPYIIKHSPYASSKFLGNRLAVLLLLYCFLAPHVIRSATVAIIASSGFEPSISNNSDVKLETLDTEGIGIMKLTHM